MKTGKAYFQIILLFTLTIIAASELDAYTWEVAIRTVNSNGDVVYTNVIVYTLNSSTRDFVVAGSGTTGELNISDGTNWFNGAFDIGSNNTSDPLLGPLAAGGTYYIRIGNKYLKLEYESGSYGDIEINYITTTASWTVMRNNSGYIITGPYTWSEKTITLKNDFGNDKTSCSGNILFNSSTLSSVGYSGTSLTRESGTFPHTISGIDNQYINSYYRKWRNWSEDGYTVISRDLSSVLDYTNTAKYAKQVNVSISNSFVGVSSGGVIKVDGTTYSCPTQSLYFYDDGEYSIIAPYQQINYINYSFDHWSVNGSTYSTSSSLTYSNPSTGVTLTAHYTGIPDKSPMDANLDSCVTGYPVKICWTDHPNTSVMQYRIYRGAKVESNLTSPIVIATVSRGTTRYIDNEYIVGGDDPGTVAYDVVPYYSTEGTWGYVGMELISATPVELIPKLAEQNAGAPSEYKLENYPNPFNPTTTISYQLPEAGMVTLKVYDMLGKEVATLVNEVKQAGYYSATFDASKLASGIYISTIKTNKFTQSKKMMLVK